MKYAAIDSMRQRYPISMLCELLGVSRSGYHEWRCREPSTPQRANERLLSQIRVLHAESFGSYGSPRIHAALRLSRSLSHIRGQRRRNPEQMALVFHQPVSASPL